MRVEKDLPAGHVSDIDQLRPFIASPAPTEPKVTNVTSASTARITVGDDERIPSGMLVEPAPRPLVEFDRELVHHEIMPLARVTELSIDIYVWNISLASEIHVNMQVGATVSHPADGGMSPAPLRPFPRSR